MLINKLGECWQVRHLPDYSLLYRGMVLEAIKKISIGAALVLNRAITY